MSTAWVSTVGSDPLFQMRSNTSFNMPLPPKLRSCIIPSVTTMGIIGSRCVSLLMLDLPELEPLLVRVYSAFSANLEKGSGLVWGPPEKAIGASAADEKRYADLGPADLATADPSIAALHAVLLRSVIEREPMLSTTLGFPVIACADLTSGPILRLAYYPPKRGETVNHDHADIDLVTVLPRATASGLQILQAGTWGPCAIAPNAIAVLPGDLAREFGGPAATRHRVVSDGRPRMSVSLFVNARPDLQVRNGSTVLDDINLRLQKVRGGTYE